MELKEYHRMFELEGSHWWFQGRLSMTEGLLRRYILPATPRNSSGPAPARPRLLDLGCGTGLFLQRRAADCEGYGADFAAQALHYCHARDVHRLVQADAGLLPLADASFDIVTAFDLIEHVKDDHGLVREIHRVLKPGGFLLASVPAHPFLWTGHDVSLHHHRRYRRVDFNALFARQEWETVRLTAGFTFIFPIAALIRGGRRLFSRQMIQQSDTRPVPEWFNRALIALHRCEAACVTRFDLPIGVSLMTIRRKK